MVQRLRFQTSTAEAWDQSLKSELRSHSYVAKSQKFFTGHTKETVQNVHWEGFSLSTVMHQLVVIGGNKLEATGPRRSTGHPDRITPLLNHAFKTVGDRFPANFTALKGVPVKISLCCLFLCRSWGTAVAPASCQQSTGKGKLL